MAGLRPGTLRGEDHWSRYDHTHAAPTGLTTANIVTGDPVAIDPDDVMAAGAATSLARSDHQHAFTSGAAAALTRTAASGEGAAATHARSDHVHATDQLSWGRVGAAFSSTADSVHSATGTTDMSITSSWLATRDYAVTIHTRLDVSAAGDWSINLAADGTVVQLLFHVVTIGASTEIRLDRTFFWQPAATVTTLDVRVVENAGTSTLTFQGVPGPPADTRQLWVTDIGPR
jgi:hypothetical protein